MIPILTWWLLIQLFALAAMPLAWRLFARLPSRGYPLAKALGLLLVSYILWLGASFHLLANDVGGILIALVLVIVLSLWLGRAGLRRTGEKAMDRPILAWLRSNWRLVLATEVLTIVVLGAWAVFRAYSGDIVGTEKPMEFAFINGVLDSRFFPPQDPWLSGYAISYYYFGYVMLGVLIRLSGVGSAVGFNLGVAMWYALTLVSAFGLGYDLVVLGRRRGASEAHGFGIGYGVLGALFVGVVGNLEGIVEAAYNLRLVPLAWIQWLNVKDLTSSPPSGALGGGFWWWWRASRVIHDQIFGKSIEVIDEFPFFSYLLGDLHPHVLGLPFVLLAIGLALNLLLTVQELQPGDVPVAAANAAGPRASMRDARAGEDDQVPVLDALRSGLYRLWDFLAGATGLGAPGILLYAVVLGGLSFLNTWDFPIYLSLTIIALAAGLAMRKGLHWDVIGQAVGSGVILGVLGVLLYLPFYVGFQSQAGGLLPNLLFPTRFSQYFLMFGPFLVALVFLLSVFTREAPRGQVRRGFLSVLPWMLLLPALLLAAALVAGIALPSGRALVQSVLSDPDIRNGIGGDSPAQLAGLVLSIRAANPWTWLFLAGLVAWIAGLLGARFRNAAAVAEGRAEERGEARTVATPVSELDASCQGVETFVLLMAGLALLLTFVVEFVYLRDLFGTRMNTVFKFYYQAWVLLALASVYAVGRLADRGVPARVAMPGLALVGVLVFAGLYYPLEATPNKANDFTGTATLNGLAFMNQTAPGDLAAIDWIKANIAPTATVLEATGGSYSPAGRISMSTGNPTLLGWDFHERQWRGEAYDKLAAGRPDAIDQIYRSASGDQLRSLLDRWGIDYVYVGALERSNYQISDASLARFDRALRLVYNKDGVRIYAR